ncbi:flagellar biosynthesis protein FliQ [Candidatus Endoriftia persephone str. Guaymas]|jgi:flagellar biosynthetic protein FliQ|uniref:Flagellar biosynthetic protein FliQ n=4 Tax=Gammaproteobacteria TaxID=1236 RepID=G2FHR1_9GAMM|nr:flagellar biosynthesis protein FliQ [Candidatus Endoriftia persephone]MBA1332387.1 flagellar biosynthesis protein FliQ [Candidatus Endoriftia persephone str. Guaymas]EGV52230.1 Flagellar biosynthesis protein fliQ [endosymbiont of Riftia pachyptila (vent Ph05)]EGW53705.1 flagellar biosynthesis protein FliQ [endosymbiont of Tevnia jerichonana (vent Tica)]KRT55631.1 flagellar biosynthetic protein FliQ [endosymbiont of Ridgeia piscesae]KRT57952.1 flagellar biosynthetic protein FliQ [endosymbion
MDPDTVITIGQQTMQVIGSIIAVVLLPALAVGLIVATFQAATQINEMTLTFIPKLAVVGMVLMVAGPWMLRTMTDFARTLIESIPELISMGVGGL